MGKSPFSERKTENLCFLAAVVYFLVLRQMDQVPFCSEQDQEKQRAAKGLDPCTHPSHRQAGRDSCGCEMGLENKFGGKILSYLIQRQLLPHFHMNIWVCRLQRPSPSIQPYQMTFKHQMCSGFPSVSFIVEAIAALTAWATILIMRLLSRLWPLAKIAPNWQRQLLSYGKQTREVCALGWTAFSVMSHAHNGSALVGRSLQESLWLSHTFLGQAKHGDALPVGLYRTHLI